MKTMRQTVSELRQSAWAIRAELVPAIAAALAGGDIRGDDPDQADTQAAVRGASTTGGVAMLPLRGLITPRPSFLSILFGGGGGLQGFRQSLREALASDDIAAIVIDVDSPGGSTDLVAETAAEIRAARGIKPIIAVANTMAASAAYWLAAQADELVITPSGEVGSIGVFCVHEDISKLNEELGVTTTLISAGKYKTEGNPFEPLSDEARQAFQEKVDEFYGLFVADVAKGRGVTANAVRNGFGEGRMVTAKQAVAAGMADRVDTLEATIAKLVRSPGRTSRRAELDDAARRLAAGETVDDADASDVRTAAALLSLSSGTPALTPPSGGQEPARPSESYVDVMYGTTR